MPYHSKMARSTSIHTETQWHDDVLKWKQFSVTGPLWKESTGGFSSQSVTKAWICKPKQTVDQTTKLPVDWDTIILVWFGFIWSYLQGFITGTRDNLLYNQWSHTGEYLLTHWGRVTHICVSDLTIISSYNGLSPGRRQAIICTNAGILLIGPSGTNFNGILFEIIKFSDKKMNLKMSSAKWGSFCPGSNLLCGLYYSDRNMITKKRSE